MRQEAQNTLNPQTQKTTKQGQCSQEAWSKQEKGKESERKQKVHTGVSVIEPPLVCLLVLLHRPDGQYLHNSPPPKNSDNSNNNADNNDNADALVLCAQGKAKTGRSKCEYEREETVAARERERGAQVEKGGKKRDRANERAQS